MSFMDIYEQDNTQGLTPLMPMVQNLMEERKKKKGLMDALTRMIPGNTVEAPQMGGMYQQQQGQSGGGGGLLSALTGMMLGG